VQALAGVDVESSEVDGDQYFSLKVFLQADCEHALGFVVVVGLEIPDFQFLMEFEVDPRLALVDRVKQVVSVGVFGPCDDDAAIIRHFKGVPAIEYFCPCISSICTDKQPPFIVRFIQVGAYVTFCHDYTHCMVVRLHCSQINM